MKITFDIKAVRKKAITLRDREELLEKISEMVSKAVEQDADITWRVEF